MLKRFGVFATLVVAAATLSASSPTFWTVSTQPDFLKGDVSNLSIDGDGRVSLGPATAQLAETSAPFLWTLLAGPDGSLWAGTGNEGQVLKIYRVAADGTATTFFDPDDKYIWALAVAPDGALFAATGQKGNIYRITPDVKGSLFYKTNTANVVSLAVDKAGNVIAGTESPGRVFRIDKNGKAFVLLDSPFKEIHALKIASDGSIYAAAFSGTPGGEDRAAPAVVTAPEPPPHVPVPSVSAEITGITVIDASTGLPAAGSAREPRAHNAKGAIYRIRA